MLAGLLRVMQRVHAERRLVLDGATVDAALCFAGEAQDLAEVLGNLLDNACQWAWSRVVVTVNPARAAPGAALAIVVEDDGPGTDEARRAAVMARGTRLDESTPGSGLGPAIVGELVGLYGGAIRLGAAPAGGLRRVELTLPAVA